MVVIKRNGVKYDLNLSTGQLTTSENGKVTIKTEEGYPEMSMPNQTDFALGRTQINPYIAKIKSGEIKGGSSTITSSGGGGSIQQKISEGEKNLRGGNENPITEAYDKYKQGLITSSGEESSGVNQSYLNNDVNTGVSGGTQVDTPINTISAYQPTGRFDVARNYFRGGSEAKRLFGEFATPFINVGELGFSFAKSPIETTKGIGYGLVLSGKKVISGEGFPDVSYKLATDPLGSTARIGGELALLKGSSTIPRKTIIKGVDLYRTRGLTELPKEVIIAPEFPTQAYPRISKGQTAGELLAEFKQQEIYGATKLSGFHASPKPVSNVITGSGSELPGLYIAPKLNPTFLRVSGESKQTFSFKFGETLRPTISKVNPTDFELTPFVKSSQKNLAPLKQTQEFFYTKAEKGKGYVPFIKTEKEAVIPFETTINPTKDKFFIRFEGRKIPIKEYDVGEVNKISGINNKLIKEKKALDISKSSYGVGKTSKFDILDLSSSVISISKSNYKPISSGVGSIGKSPKYNKNIMSDTPSIPSPKPSYPKSISSSYFNPISSKRYTPTSYSYSNISNFKSPNFSNKVFLDFKPIEIKSKSSNLVLPRNQKRTPSLIALALDIKSPKAKEGEFTGLIARPIISKRKSRRKKK